MTDMKKLYDFLGYARQQTGPRLSLHQRSHRSHPENRADPIVYKNTLQELQKQLIEGPIPRRDWWPAWQAMEGLLDDQDFWNHTPDGIIVLAAGERMQVFPLEYPVENQHHIGNHFHLLPLFRFENVLGDAYLVDLSRDRFTMHLVNPQSLHEVRTPQIKQSFPELFDDFDANANLRVGSFGGKDGMHYGHRARPEELQKDRDKYFRYLSDSFSRLHRDSGMHFILAGTTDTLAHYQKIASSHKYLDGTIDKPLDTMDEKEVLLLAAAIMKPLIEKELGILQTQASNAKNEGKVLHSLAEMLPAAEEGRIQKLILVSDLKEADRDKAAALVDSALAAGAEIISLQARDRLLDQDYTAILRY